jgi:hypothetical protein
MATRQQRMDAFSNRGEPPMDRLFELLCQDHVGTYVLPFLCRWDGAWRNGATGGVIAAEVLGWREPFADTARQMR